MSTAEDVSRTRPVAQAGTTDGSVVLEARQLCVGYGAVPVVHDLDLVVTSGEVVALLGANGAGKTTTLSALVGELPPSSGTVELLGESAGQQLHKRAARGLGYIPEERSVITSLNVRDNLRLGPGPVDAALETFPELIPLLKRRAGLLSGGEQQILTVARALAAAPKILLADELSLGLAPLVVRRILVALRAAADRGMGILVVEQQVRTALSVSDRAYVLRRGRVVLSGRSVDLLEDIESIERTYLST